MTHNLNPKYRTFRNKYLCHKNKQLTLLNAIMLNLYSYETTLK
ncbi:hypothetical protein HFN_0924 [Helicobacter fennelliae MRY12-0050]|uniref:Uncharacterized protein n=1 Tax=Helicobacter fennelliae MRY12-0050 TaxID=1325130 RepID=T1CSB5_9HELI|nr:hypothetical protein HFN_0924 [Helicobacter fennelliae MRY12-0050]